MVAVFFGVAALSVGLPTLWVTWAAYRGPGDKEVARKTINFLENKMVLFGERHSGDELHCVRSAIKIREFLTEQIDAASPGKDLAESLKAMRTACQEFVQSGGPNAENFHPGWSGNENFVKSLRDLKKSMGAQIARIATQFGLPVGEKLASILPSSDGQDQE